MLRGILEVELLLKPGSRKAKEGVGGSGDRHLGASLAHCDHPHCLCLTAEEVARGGGGAGGFCFGFHRVDSLNILFEAPSHEFGVILSRVSEPVT